MRKRSLLFALPVLVLFACGKHDPDPYVTSPPPASGIKLKVTPLWNGAIFSESTIYHNIMDFRVRVSGIKLYLGDLHLLTPGGEHHLSDAAFFNLTDSAQSVFLAAPPGDYTGLHFGIGLTPSVNASDPVLFAADHPLSANNGMYWTWASQYRFVIFEGRFDTLSAGSDTLHQSFSIHTGMDTCYREREFAALPISVVTGAYTQVNVTFDLAKFFYTDTDTIDLRTDNQSHIGDTELAIRLSDLIQASVAAQ